MPAYGTAATALPAYGRSVTSDQYHRATRRPSRAPLLSCAGGGGPHRSPVGCARRGPVRRRAAAARSLARPDRTIARRTRSRSGSSTSGPPVRIGDQLLLLEHPPVLTLGRQSDPAHILATAEELAARGIEVERIERGGEVTYHGPGQLVAYPIVRLHERGLLLRPFVRALEAALVETCAAARRGGRPARRPPRLLVRPGRARAAQDRRPRPARRARRQLPRHRAQRDGRPRRLRPHRRRAGCRASSRRRSPRELGEPTTPPTTASVERAAGDLRPSVRRRDRRAARRSRADRPWRAACSSCARTRSPAGGSRRSSTAPSTATASPAPPSPSTTGCSAAPTARARRATASGRGCSRTSRSTSSGTDDEARELDRDHGLAQVSLAQARATG